MTHITFPCLQYIRSIPITHYPSKKTFKPGHTLPSTMPLPTPFPSRRLHERIIPTLGRSCTETSSRLEQNFRPACQDSPYPTSPLGTQNGFEGGKGRSLAKLPSLAVSSLSQLPRYVRRWSRLVQHPLGRSLLLGFPPHLRTPDLNRSHPSGTLPSHPSACSIHISSTSSYSGPSELTTDRPELLRQQRWPSLGAR